MSPWHIAIAIFISAFSIYALIVFPYIRALAYIFGRFVVLGILNTLFPSQPYQGSSSPPDDELFWNNIRFHERDKFNQWEYCQRPPDQRGMPPKVYSTFTDPCPNCPDK